MLGMWCRSGQVTVPSWEHIIQSDAPVGRRPWPRRYQGHGGCFLLVRNVGRGVRPLNQAGVSVGIIMQKRAPGCGQPWITVIRVEISRHQTGNLSLMHSARYESINGRVREKYAATSFNGLFANTKCIAVASRCRRPRQRSDLCPCGQGSLCLLPEPCGPSGGKLGLRTSGPDSTQDDSCSGGRCRHHAHCVHGPVPDVMKSFF
jgi:hypothetical protein